MTRQPLLVAGARAFSGPAGHDAAPTAAESRAPTARGAVARVLDRGEFARRHDDAGMGRSRGPVPPGRSPAFGLGRPGARQVGGDQLLGQHPCGGQAPSAGSVGGSSAGSVGGSVAGSSAGSVGGSVGAAHRKPRAAACRRRSRRSVEPSASRTSPKRARCPSDAADAGWLVTDGVTPTCVDSRIAVAGPCRPGARGSRAARGGPGPARPTGRWSRCRRDDRRSA